MIHYKNWASIPEHIKTKTQLRELRLKPAKNQEVIGEIYAARQWVKLYDMNDAIAIKPPTEKQLEALQKAREQREENIRINNSCSICSDWVGEKNLYEITKYVVKKTDSENFRKSRIPTGDYLCRKCSTWFNNIAIQNEIKSDFEAGFLILDTDTTGLEPGEILRLTIRNQKNEIIYDSFFKPKKETEIDWEAHLIHGLTHEKLSDQPLFSEEYERISSILEGRVVYIYNVEFDMYFFDNMRLKYGLPEVQFETKCAMKIYSRWVDARDDRYISLTDDKKIKSSSVYKTVELYYLLESMSESTIDERLRKLYKDSIGF